MDATLLLQQNDICQLLRRVFQMCDVDNRGQISIDDLITLGQQYLGQDTKVTLRLICMTQTPAKAPSFCIIAADRCRTAIGFFLFEFNYSLGGCHLIRSG